MEKRNNRVQTVSFPSPPSLIGWANIGGRMEQKGPLCSHFDELSSDPFFGQKTWEKGESVMQKRVLSRAIEKSGVKAEAINYVFAGDLLNQCIGSSYAMRDFSIPFYGIYGACSTMGEGLSLAGMLIAGGFADTAAVMASSHFCTAERQYRMPVPYGSQRTPTAQWTATAAGCCLLAKNGSGPYITHATCGKVVDMGITDANNMGAAMMGAAHDTLCAFFRDTGTAPKDYDLIVTGDLGELGHELLVDFLLRDGIDLRANSTDCGMLLYDRRAQDMHAGGSGAGCCASVLCGYLLDMMREKKWKRVVFAPTGALLSPTATMQGESIPAVCHAVCLCAQREV